MTKFVLPVSASGFSKPYSHVNGSTDLNTSFHSVVRALVTTGHLPAFTKPFDDYRSASIRMRVALGQAHLAVRNNRTRSQLVPSPEWARLDPSEKAFASFLLGSAMAKLVAAQMLRCPMLLHLSMYERAFDIDFGGARRPDFIGQTLDGDWIVVEAKGRSRLTRSVLADAKVQAMSISKINGTAPISCVASGTRFNKNLVSVELLDPPANPEGAIVDFPTEAFFRTYYEPIMELLDESERTVSVSGQEVDVVRLPGLDLAVGLESRLAAQMRRQRPFVGFTMGDVLGRSDARIGPDQSPDTSWDSDQGEVGQDGVFVQLGQSWSGSPSERT